MDRQQLKDWGEIEDEFTVDSILPANHGHTHRFCDAQGTCVELLLFPDTDLSAIERHRLAEHVQTCSACASRSRLYQRIENIAGELPRYNLQLRRKRLSTQQAKQNSGIRTLHREDLQRLDQRQLGKISVVLEILYLVVLVLCLITDVSGEVIWIGIGGIVVMGIYKIYRRVHSSHSFLPSRKGRPGITLLQKDRPRTPPKTPP